MDFGQPLAVTLAANAELHTKVRMFLGHYDIRLYLTDKSYVDADRGSFDAALMVKYTIEGHEGCLGTIGQFCNCASRSEIFGGGEHHND
ncbi:MAG TPA: hypothetical protein VEA35_04580, partial [Ramlibacter sp.]|nr:hypothetical protein [Ramlibacter sp.]